MPTIKPEFIKAGVQDFPHKSEEEPIDMYPSVVAIVLVLKPEVAPLDTANSTDKVPELTLASTSNKIPVMVAPAGIENPKVSPIKLSGN